MKENIIKRLIEALKNNEASFTYKGHIYKISFLDKFYYRTMTLLPITVSIVIISLMNKYNYFENLLWHQMFLVYILFGVVSPLIYFSIYNVYCFFRNKTTNYYKVDLNKEEF